MSRAGEEAAHLIDNLFGQIEGLSGGEISLGGRRLGENGYCGCGLRIRDCPVWQSVLTRAFGDMDEATRAMLSFFQIGRHLGDLPALAMGRATAGFGRRHHDAVERIDALYAAIAAETGCRVIVDSSKFPPYGLALGLAPSIDLYVLHLVRDPRAVAFSWLRQKPAERTAVEPLHRRQFGPTRSAWRWLLVNGLSEWSFASLGDRYRRVRYEDYIAAPNDMLLSLLDWVGERGAPPRCLAEGRVQLQPTHAISGNPSRFNTGSVPLRVDDEWKRQMARRDRAVVSALTWPLCGRYGYDV
ncbi:MAG: hypothetical protein U1E97_03330 [Alphaproteobacteria bacterium]